MVVIDPQSSAQNSSSQDSGKGIDVTLSNFMAEVIEASRKQLVIVDFWATWCGPCKQLAPVLEKVIGGYKGAIRLAKVDIDKNRQIAQQMGVQSVPAVFAFFQGRPVDGFMGAVLEAQVKAWIDRLVQATGVSGQDDQAAGLGTALKQAADFLASGDAATARSIYEDILGMDPFHAEAYAGVLRCWLAVGDVTKAQELLAQAPAEVAKNKALEPVRAALELAQQAKEAMGGQSDLEEKLAQDPNDHQARYDLAMAFYAAGERERAVDALLEIVRRNRTWNEEAARKQLVKFFEAFGATDPLTIATRRRLSSILFS